MMAVVVQRRVAAVVGALVADAAAQPLHWIYNLEKLHALVGTREDVAFWDPSANPFYTLPCGALSGYGDQAFTILKSLVDSNGFDPENLKKSTLECFGPNSKYENPVNAVYKDKADIAKKNAKYPIDGPWRHASIKEFLRNFAEGKEVTGAIDDEQIDCALRVVPVVALYAGRPEMLSVAEQVIRQTQNNDLAVAVGLTASRLLEYYILHGPSDDAIDDVIRQLSTAGRSNPQELDTAMVAFLREVVRKKNVPHLQATKDFTNN
ncbi:crystallin J1A-like [Dreissena polymorpha]|uniref:Uncharacterized protein n=1 Tax=Dreissena polymorpha TaxID=45954 RepID=A0A9D4FGF9_DREPO|nr:crystallin J1A-like [Dreissena polymorpha]KAH3796858.1 hypothetical protein DPMN_150433 [Dreissena polymorpha]